MDQDEEHISPRPHKSLKKVYKEDIDQVNYQTSKILEKQTHESILDIDDFDEEDNFTYEADIGVDAMNAISAIAMD
jgi:hypothetical protein